MATRKPGPSGRDLTPEELDLWAAVTRDTRALDPAARRRSAIGEHDQVPESRDTIDAAPARPAKPTPKVTPIRTNAGKPAAPRPGAGTDRRTQVRLRRGHIEVDGRIDLHGMTQAQARGRLETFLADSAGRGHRCVLVITGKGSRRADGDDFMPDRERGVLREQVPRWLALPPLAGHVVTWQTAARRHGGDGALYVLLRRRK